MQVDRLRSKEHPKISKIIFQQHTPPSSESPSLVEHMVIATRYGLFVYESTFLLTQKKDSQDVHLSVRYKLSVLPDEAVVDIVEIGESNSLLVSCVSGNNVVLTRHAQNGVL